MVSCEPPLHRFGNDCFPYDHSQHAWADDQHANMHEEQWTQDAPAGYNTFAQRRTYPAGDSTSWIEPYVVRDHSWNVAEHDQSNEKTWKADSPGKHYDSYAAFAQAHTYPAGDSTSWIEPYVVRDHSWNVEEYDQSN